MIPVNMNHYTPRSAMTLTAPLLALALWLMLLAGCGGKVQEISYPVYRPTAGFLEMQEQVKRRAREIKIRNELEVRLYILKGQTKYYRDWEPIHRRIQAAQAKHRKTEQ